MTLRAATLLLIVATLLTEGCNKSEQSTELRSAPAVAPTEPAAATAADSGAPASAKDAELIREAIEDHVREDHSVNMSALDMTVDSMSVSGDQAQASATFRAKQGGPGMDMSYLLERRGGAWAVVRGQPGGGQFTHPPMDQTQSGMPANSPANSAAPTAPDVTDFLKNHPAPNNN
jgi:hypothetical protein